MQRTLVPVFALATFLFSSGILSRADEEPSSRSLVERARERFGDADRKLGYVDSRLFKAIQNGDVADLTALWGLLKLELPADRIDWLAEIAETALTPKGVRVKGARITGRVDLSLHEVPVPLIFHQCDFDGLIDLEHAHLISIEFPGSHVQGITANRVTVKGSVKLDSDFTAAGEVSFYGGKIGGDLDCDGGHFNHEGLALQAENLTVGGGAYLRRGFTTRGNVKFMSATIGKNLECDDGRFDKGLDAEGLSARAVLLRWGFKIGGPVRLFNARIGQLECDGGVFLAAINTRYCRIEQDVSFDDGLVACGEIDLQGATIGGNLDCSNSAFLADSNWWNRMTGYDENTGSNRVAINARLTNIGGLVALTGTKTRGVLDLASARIDKGVYGSGARFFGLKGDYALLANNVTISGPVLLDALQATGSVSFFGATVTGNFDLSGSQLRNECDISLNLSRISVAGNMFLSDRVRADGIKNEFQVDGKVVLIDAMISGDVLCNGGAFTNRSGAAIDAWNLRLEGSLITGYGFKAAGEVRLDGARIGGDWDCVKGEFLNHGGLAISANRLSVGRSIFMNRGFAVEGDIEQFGISVRGNQYSDVKWGDRLWNFAYGQFLGYGFDRWRPLRYGAFIICIGCVVFGISYRMNILVAVKETNSEDGSDRHRKFNFFMYSLDTFIPLINLHQAEHWLPDANRLLWLRIHWSGLLRGYHWFQIISGWVLTTLLLVGLTGLIKT